MIPEAHDAGDEPRTAVLFLVGGVALFATLSIYAGG
jgi:hypothetical protein